MMLKNNSNFKVTSSLKNSLKKLIEELIEEAHWGVDKESILENVQSR